MGGPTDSSAPGERRLRILFFLWALNYDRIFECFVRELLRRGHAIHVLLETEKGEMPVGAGEVFRALAAEAGGRLTWERLPRRQSPRDVVARMLRRTSDYLRYLEPEYASASALRGRTRRRLPPVIARLIDATCAQPSVRRRIRGLVDGLERSLPPSPVVLERIRAAAPDVVMVAPLITLGSPQGDVVPAASTLRVPTVLPVASWDNLTNKGLVRAAPTRTIVWNEGQVDEAVRLHRIPRERVAAVGAHSFDHWFGWTASTSTDEFAARAGVDGGRPLLLYACSSAFVAGDESEFVREWLTRLRAGPEPLRDAAVIVRPHPQNVAIWDGVEPGPGAVVWPRGGEVPTAASRKADYFDSLFHARAVVGINTSTLVESAIVGRPVFTILTDRYRTAQSGTLHFEHLAGADGRGLLNVARSWDEHLAQLADAIERPEAYRPRIDEFVQRFVRPRGTGEPAAPRAADVVEEAAGERVAPLEPGRLGAGAALLIAATRAWLWAVGRLRRAAGGESTVND